MHSGELRTGPKTEEERTQPPGKFASLIRCQSLVSLYLNYSQAESVFDVFCGRIRSFKRLFSSFRLASSRQEREHDCCRLDVSSTSDALSGVVCMISTKAYISEVLCRFFVAPIPRVAAKSHGHEQCLCSHRQL